MTQWLLDNKFPSVLIEDGTLEFPTQKPAAFITIDDRAMCFRGVFPTPDEIRMFKPWNKGGVGGPDPLLTAPKKIRISTEQAVEVLTTALREDPGFYLSYQANIACAIQDTFLDKTPKEDWRDLHRRANNAARLFMSRWGCGNGENVVEDHDECLDCGDCEDGAGRYE